MSGEVISFDARIERVLDVGAEMTRAVSESAEVSTAIEADTGIVQVVSMEVEL